MTLAIQIKILDPRLRDWGHPKWGSDLAAGLDLFACLNNPIILEPQAPAVLIPTGVAVFVGQPGACAMIYPRSGLGHKRGLVLGNGTGVIDADYQNQVFVSAWNRNPREDRKHEIEILPGDRIAQLVFTPILRPTFEEVEEFSDATARGLGGFGSSGVSAAE